MESIVYTIGQVNQNTNHHHHNQQQQQQSQLQQQQQQQPTTSQQTISSNFSHSTAPQQQNHHNQQQPQHQQNHQQSTSTGQQQNIYQVKCGLLEYHIQEAILVNKALRSELKQYRDKIEFEKKFRKFLVNRVKGSGIDS